MSDGRSKGEAYTREYFEAAGVALGQVSRAMEGYRTLAVMILGISIRGPVAEGGDFLATVRGEDETGQRVVSFQSASTLIEVFRGLEGRLASGTVKWQPDKYVK